MSFFLSGLLAGVFNGLVLWANKRVQEPEENDSQSFYQ